MSTNSEEIAILLFNDGDLIKENSLNIGSENWKLVFYDSDHYHILLHIWPDAWVQPLDGDKIRLSSEEIFQAKERFMKLRKAGFSNSTKISMSLGLFLLSP